MLESVSRTRAKAPGARSATATVARNRRVRAAATPYGKFEIPVNRPSFAARMARMVKDLSTSMLNRAIGQIVQFCTRHIWPILLVGAVLAVAGGGYAAKHFSINADV